jgi:hypothetical protein
MKAGEIQVLKDLVDAELPKLEAAEVQRLMAVVPALYQPLVSAILPAIENAVQAALDAAIAKIPVDPS